MVDITIKGDKLIIEVDISDKAIKSAPLSKKEANKVVASTRGFQAPSGANPKGIRVGLNVLAPK